LLRCQVSTTPRQSRGRAVQAHLLWVAALASACAGTSPTGAASPSVSLRDRGLRGPDDPTVRGARVVPEALDTGRTVGVEPGGGVRTIVSGVRVVSFGDGSVVAATDRLPGTAGPVLAVPERMGGGFLFAIGKELWRSEVWLGHVRRVATVAAPISQVLVGLDRVYLRWRAGGLDARDPRTGAPLDLGPMPASPHVSRVAAIDGWRAAAIADMRGAAVTTDAGATWRTLQLPVEPTDVVAMDDMLAIGGLDANRAVEWWEVRSDGQPGKLAGPPGGLSVEPHAAGRPSDVDSAEPGARLFGTRPLVAAVEDGWPLVDGTAIVARDGTIGRVRLPDGALVETVLHAFPLTPARCHPLSLATAREPGAFGFVCGEARGRTIVYRWDAAASRMVEMRRFDAPREVLASGSGGLAVRGTCAPDGESPRSGGDRSTPGAPPDGDAEQWWCVMTPAGEWRETRFTGPGVERARAVVLSDGRLALVRPPEDGDLSTTRVTIVDGTAAAHVPVSFPDARADVARVLRAGLWMDGWEERRKGVVGGWVDAGGSVVGVEIDLAGHARVGEYVRDAGVPVVSGRYGFGWTASRRGYETTDGGMTWVHEDDLPDPAIPLKTVRERACGPVGCLAAGWIRVGWGPTPAVADPPAPRQQPPSAWHAQAQLKLECESAAGTPPTPKVAARPAAKKPTVAPPVARRPWQGGTVFNTGSWGTVAQFPPFLTAAGPAMGVDDLGVTPAILANDVGRTMRNVSLGAVYAWGPKTGDWDQLGRWQVRWLWPWGGWPEMRASSIATAPWANSDQAKRALGFPPNAQITWTLAAGDDPDHALLVARHTATTGGTAEVTMLDADRAPVEVRRANGESLPDVDSAQRVGGRWYLATSQAAQELAATVVWALDGGGAHEIARVPRAGVEGRATAVLARRSDGRALGIVVDGQPDDQGYVMRWVESVDLETGTLGEPEPLAPADLSDRPLTLCSGDDSGWVVDLPFAGPVRMKIGPTWEAPTQNNVVRLRLARGRACVERVFGTFQQYGGAVSDMLTKSPRLPARSDARTVEVSLFTSNMRYPLRCTQK
jgi:hypothetical protein